MKIAGIIVSGHSVNIVIISGEKPPFDCESEETFPLQTGDRARAYSVVFTQVDNFLKHHQVDKTVFKGSALSGRAGQTEAMLLAAELRGVVQVAAINAKCEVSIIKKAVLSRTRSRKFEDYISDEPFWKSNLPQLKKKTLRQTALLAVLDRIPAKT